MLSFRQMWSSSPQERENSPRVQQKRKIEDAIVQAITSRSADFGLVETLNGFLDQIRKMPSGVYYSARRAHQLLREKLFQRAYALRVPRFAMNYRGAELDMHFSISTDLHQLEDMVRILREDGLHGLSVYLERGTFQRTRRDPRTNWRRASLHMEALPRQRWSAHPNFDGRGSAGWHRRIDAPLQINPFAMAAREAAREKQTEMLYVTTQ